MRAGPAPGGPPRRLPWDPPAPAAEVAGGGSGGGAGAGVGAGGGAVVLHEDVAVAELGEAAASGSAGTSSPRRPSLGLGTPTPGRGGCPPGRMEGAGCLPPLLLWALGHRLPSQPEDTAEQSVTAWHPPPRGRAQEERHLPRHQTRLTRCRKARYSELLNNTSPSSHPQGFWPQPTAPPGPNPPPAHLSAGLPSAPGPLCLPPLTHPGRGSRLQSMV